MAEGEKRRATTFRTSKGTIVNVAAPTVYVSPAFLSTEDVTNPTELREALREELGYDYIGGQHLASGRNADSLFFGRYNAFGEAPNTRELDADAFLPLRLAGLREVQFVGQYNALYSKHPFKYGQFVHRIQTPAWDNPSWSASYIGAESTGSAIGGIARFAFGPDLVNHNVDVSIALDPCPYGGGLSFGNIQNLAGCADPAAAPHNWTVKLNRASAEYYCDANLIGIIQAATGADSYRVSGTLAIPAEPYVLGQVPGIFPTHQPSLFEVVCSGATYVGTKPGFYLDNISVCDGDPAPPRTLHPYTGGVKWKGTVVNPNLTSDGIPVAGYDTRMVFFLATGAGTLEIYVDYGDNVYDLYATLIVAANTLAYYIIDGEPLWVKLKYIPTAPPKTITRARVTMR